MKTSFAAGMHHVLLAVLLPLAGLLMVACEKDSVPVNKDYSKIDDDIIIKYLADNKITTARRQPSGLYYVPVLTDSSHVRAVAGKTVSVLYKGMYMNGNVFEESSYTFVLGRGEVIQGWDEGIALMHKGDKAVLLIPSALGYGSNGSHSIPPNTVLRFDVELKDVK